MSEEGPELIKEFIDYTECLQSLGVDAEGLRNEDARAGYPITEKTEYFRVPPAIPRKSRTPSATTCAVRARGS